MSTFAAPPQWTLGRRPPRARLARRSARLADGLLAAGIVGAGASQFRLGAVPLGPGEICLFGWFALRLAAAFLHGGWRLGPPARAVAAFWLAFAAALALGLLRALAGRDLIHWPDVLHDVVAYAVAALLCVLCLEGEDAGFRLRRATRDLMGLGTLVLLAQIVSAGGLVGVSGIDPWFYDRFRGWADNPNQLSLFCAVLIAIAAVAGEAARTGGQRWMALACASVALTAGLMTKGNTLRLSLLLGLGCYGAVAARLALAGKARGRSVRALMLLFTLLALPLGALSLAPFAASFKTQDIAEQVTRDKDQTVDEANLRFELWDGAWEAGLRSMYLGLGPGPHVLVPETLVIRQKWEPDPADNTLGDVVRHGATMESHNTYLELFSQGGLLVVGAFAWLVARAGRQALRARSAALPALLCVVLTFAMFHVILRHPVVWFGLCLCLDRGGWGRAGKRPSLPRP